MKVFHNLNPIYNKDSKILILGSIPSITSRQENFYYAHPTNRFWKILSHLFNEKLDNQKEKINFLHKYHIALWDTIATCEIDNSKDSSIKNIIPNNIKMIIHKTKITTIFVTGKKALEIYNKYIYPQTLIKAFYLSSPSSANAQKNFLSLTNEYKIIKHKLIKSSHPIKRKDEKMTKVPKMISTKDLAYITDIFNWNITIAKKLEKYETEIENDEIVSKFSDLALMHKDNCAKLIKILESESKND